MLETRKVDVLS